MPLFFKLILCIVISLVMSGFYTGWITDQKINFEYNIFNFIFFSFSSILSLFLSSISYSPLTQIFNFKFFKKNSNRKIGTVKWFSGSKGFGFIICNNGEELFVHFRSIKKGSKRLNPGSKVQYSIMYGEKGAEAKDVIVI